MGRQVQSVSANPFIFLTSGMGFFAIYDMCKAIDRGMVMTDIRVMEKHGGKSGSWKVE